ncbi:MAG: hypothetical protein HY824_07740 [Acidobacteria bacterium]|nr:hypothetical protein [Acidobacteriota bacterium]
MSEDRDAYCREVESYLCRKNDGHLVRIVGPAFEQVCGWAARGIPLKIVFRGVDRYFERYYAKGPRRRPVRIEFCDADVLDVFDEWRRAVGVAQAEARAGGAEDAEASGRRRESLSGHLDRVVARLVARRGGEDRSLDAVLDDVVRELDAARAGSKALRGERREALLQRLRDLDARLLDAARAAADGDTLARLAAEAEAQLSPFRGRMPPAAYAQSAQACVDRLLREHARLPTIAFD